MHGDLHPANVIVTNGTLTGVVDFGAMFAGDPAADLAAAWVLLPAGMDARFFAAYAEADEAMVRRARAGRTEEPLPDADGPERGPRRARRQASVGSAGTGGARSGLGRALTRSRADRRYLDASP